MHRILGQASPKSAVNDNLALTLPLKRRRQRAAAFNTSRILLHLTQRQVSEWLPGGLKNEAEDR